MKGNILFFNAYLTFRQSNRLDIHTDGRGNTHTQEKQTNKKKTTVFEYHVKSHGTLIWLYKSSYKFDL